MDIPTFESFADAYVAGLRGILEDGESVPGVNDPLSIGSDFGKRRRPTRELRPLVFRVEDPTLCLICSETRQPAFDFVFGQWIWVMRGSDSVDDIAYYNRRGRDFSDDGKTLNGAFGARLRVRWGDQLTAAIRTLRADQSSRRAFVVIAAPDDVASQSRDHPCAIGLQLLVRRGRLEAITTMRSQSALMVLPYDAALFMLIHVWAAVVLDLPPGPHTWFANSFHVYDDEVELARRVVDSGVRAIRLPSIKEPSEGLLPLLHFEEDLRRFVARGDSDSLAKRIAAHVPSAEFHDVVRSLLLARAARCLDSTALVEQATSALADEWQECLKVRGPTQAPAAHRARR